MSPPRPARDVPVADAPGPAAIETVNIMPYYALAGTRPVDPPTYRVVEVAHEPGIAQSEIERREMRRLLAEAKREFKERRRAQPRARPLERNGWECLLCPLLFWRGILGFAALWAILGPMLILALPSPEEDADAAAWLARLPLGLIAMMLMGLTWNFLRQVQHTAMMGSSEPASGVFDDFLGIVRSGFMAGAALLAGPIWLVAVAVWFWMDAGALHWLDHFILWQLVGCACVAWVYLLLAADVRGRLLDLHAVAVVRLLRRQGWPAWLFPLLGGASLAVFCFLWLETWIGPRTAGPKNNDPWGSWFSQILLWSAALFLWTFLMRWYGVTCYWQRQASKKSAA